jgi:hypothetical protein
MSCRLLTVVLMASTVAFATQSDAAVKLNSSRSNIYRGMTPKATTGPAARATTVKSNSSDRMGGGGGKSTMSGRMGGGGGGKGAVR